jgi:hypothetical protein
MKLQQIIESMDWYKDLEIGGEIYQHSSTYFQSSLTMLTSRDGLCI